MIFFLVFPFSESISIRTELIYPQTMSKESTPTGNAPGGRAAINPIQLSIVRFESVQVVPARLHGAGEGLENSLSKRTNRMPLVSRNIH